VPKAFSAIALQKPFSSTDFTDCVERTCPQMPQIVADELSAA